MRNVRIAHYILAIVLCGLCNSANLAQNSQREASLNAYGRQTTKYISIMHYTGIAVATKAVDLSRNPDLISQKSWQSSVLPQLDVLMAASKHFQSIRPVPRGYEKVNRDFAALGRQMELAAVTYKRGVKTGNTSLIYNAFGSMKQVDETLVALSKLRNR